MQNFSPYTGILLRRLGSVQVRPAASEDPMWRGEWGSRPKVRDLGLLRLLTYLQGRCARVMGKLGSPKQERGERSAIALEIHSRVMQDDTCTYPDQFL